MININQQNLIIDIDNANSSSILSVMGDYNSRGVSLSVVQNGTPLDITGLSLYIYSEDTGGNPIYNTVDIVDPENGKAFFYIPPAITEKFGSYKCCIVIRSAQAQLVSYNFIVVVYESIYDEKAIIRSKDFSVLLQALTTVDEYAELLKDSTLDLETKYTTRLNIAEINAVNAEAISMIANRTASEALDKINDAVEVSNNAAVIAKESNLKADDALQNSENAIDMASNAHATAVHATNISNTAIREAIEAKELSTQTYESVEIAEAASVRAVEASIVAEQKSMDAATDAAKVNVFDERITANHDILTDHINNHPVEVEILDSVIADDSVWSSKKICDYVLTNIDHALVDINGGDMQTINYTKEGYLSEVELFGSQENQNLGKLVVDGIGNPILDEQGRRQYNVNIESMNKNKLNPSKVKFLNKDNGCVERFEYDNNTGNYTLYNSRANNQMQIVIEKQHSTNVNFLVKVIEIYDTNGVALASSTLGMEGNDAVTMWGSIISDWKSIGKVVCKLGIEDNSIKHTSVSNILTLPCQLQKVGDVKDRVYFDKTKNKYVVEKNNTVTKTNQLIETNITKEMLVPTYRGKTHVLVTDGIISGGVKAKAPVDVTLAIQSLSSENQSMKTINEQQDDLIDLNMLATDEMYSLIEPLLPQTTYNMRGGRSSMVDMYVAMVIRGLKTIEQVPARYREEVRRILEDLDN